MILHHDDIQDFLQVLCLRIFPDLLLTIVQGDEEELTRLLVESGVVERVQVDENGGKSRSRIANPHVLMSDSWTTPQPYSNWALNTTTASGAGRCYLGVECGHRSLGSRKRSLEYCAGQSCFWLCRCYPHNDQSELPSGFSLIDRRLRYTQDTMIEQVDYVELGASLCRRLYHPRPGTEREEVERSRLPHTQGNQPADDVSYISHAHFEYFINNAFYPTPELWRRSKVISSSEEKGIRFLDTPMRRTMKKRLLPGCWTPTGPSTYVPLFPHDYC